MSHHQHLNINEREMLWQMYLLGNSMRKIASELKRAVSAISRELKRNKKKKGEYCPSVAQEKYQIRRKCCRREKILEKDPEMASVIRNLLEQQRHLK